MHVPAPKVSKSPPPPRAVPITILTGFLGAGKTTLLNRILNGDHGLRVAVLVNDFGSINIDADLVVGVESDVVSLANGCVCCSISDDLLDSVIKVLERPERPEYVLLEASGVADPASIALTFVDQGIRDRVRLDSIICVVDADQVFAVPEQNELKLRQVAFSDLLILNKVDLVGRDQIGRIRDWLDDRLNRYRLIEAVRCEVPLEIVLSGGHLDADRRGGEGQAHNGHACQGAQCRDPSHDHSHPDHGKAFDTWSYETDRALSLDALKEVASRLPVGIYRCKGVINGEECAGRRAVLQVVGKRVDISLADKWGARPPLTRIVAIGAPGAIDREALKNKFDSCRVGDPAEGNRGQQ